MNSESLSAQATRTVSFGESDTDIFELIVDSPGSLEKVTKDEKGCIRRAVAHKIVLITPMQLQSILKVGGKKKDDYPYVKERIKLLARGIYHISLASTAKTKPCKKQKK